MAPASRHTKPDEDYPGIKDRKTRKPLVEKKRRARINESLHELRMLLTESDGHEKMENAEVLEMTVRRVESILRDNAEGTDGVCRERFAAGYIQCMHEVHTFVSGCPGIDAAVAADLLNHLLECMPFNDEARFQDLLSDLMSDLLSPSASAASGDDLCSDLDDAEAEPGTFHSKSMWRPW